MSCLRHPGLNPNYVCFKTNCSQFLNCFCSQCDFQDCVEKQHQIRIEQCAAYIKQLSSPDVATSLEGKLRDVRKELRSTFNTQYQVMNMENFEFKTLYNESYKQFASIEKDIKEYQQAGPVEIDEQALKESPLSKLPQLEQHYAKLANIQATLPRCVEEMQVERQRQFASLILPNVLDPAFVESLNTRLDELSSCCLGRFLTTLNNNFTTSSNSRSLSIASSTAISQLVRMSIASRQSLYSEYEYVVVGDDDKRSSRSSSRMSFASFIEIPEQVGYSAMNLRQLCKLRLQANPEPSNEALDPLCLLTIKNQNAVITAGKSNQLYLWRFNQQSNQWSVMHQLTLVTKFNSLIQSKEDATIYCGVILARDIEISVNINQGIYLMMGGTHFFLIKVCLVESKLTEIKRVSIKCDSNDRLVKTLIYHGNMLITGMDGGGVYAYLHENLQFTLLSQHPKVHGQTITAMEMITSTVLATASNDRTVYFWGTSQNRLKLNDKKLNKFWEDIVSIKSIQEGVFLTIDSAFNAFMWEYQSSQVKLLKHFKSSEQIEVQDACLIRNNDIDRDFCAIVLCKMRNQKSKQAQCKLVLLDRYLAPIKDVLCPEYYESLLSFPIGKKNEYTTNQKFQLCFEVSVNDDDYSKYATLLAINNKPTREHFLEFKFEFNVK